MSRFTKVAFLPAFVLAFPLLASSGGQPAKVWTPNKDDIRNDNAVFTQTVNQGKGAGVTRNADLQANAWRVQTAQESGVVKTEPVPEQPKRSDSAFRK